MLNPHNNSSNFLQTQNLGNQGIDTQNLNMQLLSSSAQWSGNSSEQQRLKAIAELGLLELEGAPVFEEATQTAAHLLNAPMCILGLLEQEHHRFKSAFGLSRMGLMNDLAISRQIPRHESFCEAVVEGRQVLAIADTTIDPKFRSMRLVQHYGIQAYLGVPLFTSSGQCIGTLAVMELAPRNFTGREIEMLELVARWCMSEYERNYWQQQKAAVQPPSPVGLGNVKVDLICQMAQELRTPLTSILGMASVLNREIYGPLTGKQKEYMDIIHNSGQYLLSVLNEMLDLGALDSTQQALSLTSVDIEMVCQQALNSLQQAAQRREQQLRLTIGLGATEHIWMLDKEKVRQMIYHLILSVIQAASTDSVIRVHIATRHKQLNLSVWATHQWLGDGLPHSEVLFCQLLNPVANWPMDSAGDRPFSHFDDAPNLKPVDADPEAEAASHKTHLSRQALELMLSRQLAEVQGGRINLQGSPETGYRYVITLPQAVAALGDESP